VRLLLDTHALVWWLNDPAKLSARAAAAVSEPGNEILVSAVSCYEIELKRLRSEELQRVPESLEQAVQDEGFTWLSVGPRHMVEAGRLPLLHRDPWDRILVAQTKIERATLVTMDSWLAPYGVRTLW
jgi:PIN domain nuclease of toxin-antitoxin system